MRHEGRRGGGEGMKEGEKQKEGEKEGLGWGAAVENKGVEEGLIGRRGNLRRRRGGADELQSDRQEGSKENKQQQERVKDVRGNFLYISLQSFYLQSPPPQPTGGTMPSPAGTQEPDRCLFLHITQHHRLRAGECCVYQSRGASTCSADFVIFIILLDHYEAFRL